MTLVPSVASPAHFLFKIESFSLLSQCGIDKYETREFDAGNYKWRLVIYPNGHGIEKEAGEYVYVYLAISDTKYLPINWGAKVVFSIFIINQISGDEYFHTPGKTSHFFASKTECGIPKFISKDDLANPSNGYLVDDSCLFGAEVSVIQKYSLVTECLSLKNVETPYKHSIKIPKFSMLKNIWYSEEFTVGGFKWRISVYPNGNGDGAGHSLSIYLEYLLSYIPSYNPNTRVKADFSIFLKNQVKSIEDHKRTTSHWFRKAALDWGFALFISLARLKDPDGGFIVKDTCLLEVEISVQAVSVN